MYSEKEKIDLGLCDPSRTVFAKAAATKANAASKPSGHIFHESYSVCPRCGKKQVEAAETCPCDFASLEAGMDWYYEYERGRIEYTYRSGNGNLFTGIFATMALAKKSLNEWATANGNEREIRKAKRGIL